MKSKNHPHQALSPDAPLLHGHHKKPMTRRDFLSQSLGFGAATFTAGGILSLFAKPQVAYAQLSGDLESLRDACGINIQGAGKIPFICFDLAGGANIANSNVLVGQQGGQMDFLSTAGYSKMGYPVT